MKRSLPLAIAYLLLAAVTSRPARAWGDEGHEVIGLIANHYLDAAVREKVKNLLAGDSTHLTTTKDIDFEATWADKYRDSDRHTTQVRYNQTHDWHFADLETQAPDLVSACHGRPAIHSGTVVSKGPAHDCVVDKIEQFAKELGNPATSKRERRAALQFLLHFVGDVHQPLHASDEHDRGGNDKMVSAPGIHANTLHHYWDTEFVLLLGADRNAVAETLIAHITAADKTKWSKGTADDWAMESFNVAKRHVYGKLPAPNESGRYDLPASYTTDARKVTREQLSKAGVRLAMILNEALK